MTRFLSNKFSFSSLLVILGTLLFLIPHLVFAQEATGTTSCGTFSALYNPICTLRLFGVIIASGLMILTGFLLSIVGLLFNFLIDYTIVDFASFYSIVSPGIEGGWSAFRDIANIAIIGAFVFVAISTILGVDQYGANRFVAKLIIAAVLINFSLFLTKFTIDASNITARQFATSIDKNYITGESASIALNDFGGSTGIAGVFMEHMGVTSILGSYSSVDKIAQHKSGGGDVALLYGVVASTFFFATAAVLLYGVAYLFLRAVALIVLLMLSAVAFASFAVPKSEKLWSMWLENLLKHVFFAPSLLIFLWATLYVSSAIGAHPDGANLSKLITDPSSPISIKGIFNYVVVIGLLFASIYISKSISFAGSNYLSKLRGVAAFGTLGLGSLGAGFLARNTIGRGATRLGSWAQKKAQDQREDGKDIRAGITAGLSRRLTSLGKSDLNLMNLNALQKAAGVAGMTGNLSAKTSVGGFIGAEKNRAKKFAERGEFLTRNLSDAEKNEVTKSVMNEITSTQAGRVEVETDRDSTTASLESAKSEKNHKAQQYRDEIAALSRDLETAGTETEKEALRTSIEAKKIQQETALGTADAQISSIQKDLDKAKKNLEKLDKEATAAVSDRVARGVGEARKLQSADQVAEDLAHRRLSNIPHRVLGGQSAENDALAQEAKGLIKKGKGDKKIQDILKKFVETGDVPKEEEKKAA